MSTNKSELFSRFICHIIKDTGPGIRVRRVSFTVFDLGQLTEVWT
jgi:hypothetical protein